MKNLITALLLMVVSVSVKADQVREIDIPAICGPSENILEGLREKYNEEIIFMAPSKNSRGDDLTHSLWINHNTNTWSFVVVNRQNSTLCILGSGEDAWSVNNPGI